jgi:hypothetical protein
MKTAKRYTVMTTQMLLALAVFFYMQVTSGIFAAVLVIMYLQGNDVAGPSGLVDLFVRCLSWGAQ